MQRSPYTPDKSTKQSFKRRTLLLVDPQPLTPGSVAEFLRSADGTFEVIAVASMAAFTARSENPRTIDLSILSIGSARVSDAQPRLEIDCLRRHFAGSPLVIFADSLHVHEVQSALRLGVRGYMPTYLSAPVVLAGLRVVLAGGIFLPAGAPETGTILHGASRDPDRSSVHKPPEDIRHSAAAIDLTIREIEVLDLLRQGRTNKGIAHELNMAESTVKVHIRNMLRKLRASNRTQAIEIADRHLMPAPASADRHPD